MAYLEWSDGAGSDGTTYTLGSLRPSPGNRFFEVISDYLSVGPQKVALDRALHVFRFREDYTVHVVVRYLAPSQLPRALALKKWLIEGGIVVMYTDDADDAIYYDLQMAPGTTPELKNDDDERQLFSFTVDLAGDDPITVNYGE